MEKAPTYSKMMNMEVKIISRDTIKPAAANSSSLQHDQKPYKLSLFDQLTPMTYPTLILFYPISNPNFNLPRTLTNLKTSLSNTLTLFYPVAGRTKNNLYIDDFDQGFPYLEAQVECRMSEFLRLQPTELLNRFVPIQPFRKETETDKLPLFAIQVNIFACGGIAVGVSLSHKIFDADTGSALLNSWAAVFRGDRDKIRHPNLSDASLIFPPREPQLPQNYLDLMDSLWFKESNHVTRRFVFDGKSIGTLRAKAKSESVANPSSTATLTCFIWKSAMAASRTLSSASGNSPRTSVIAHAVNMRPRMINPQISANNLIGNMFWWAPVFANPTETETELSDLLKLLDECLKGFDSEYLENLMGEDGFVAISEYLDQLEAIISLESPDIYAFTSWNRFFDRVDFGWGKPFWTGVMGKVGPAFRNLTVFVEAPFCKGIEAWVTLEENQMALLEKDPEFLAFASPNPGISRM